MSRRSFKDLFIRIILFYFVLVTPFAIIGYMYYNYRADRFLLVTQIDQQTNIQLQVSKLKELFRHVNADLLIGANHPMAQQIFDPSSKQKEEAEERLNSFCSSMLEYNKIFEQARFINVNGEEVLSVKYINGKGVVVPKSDLQTKMHRYYMQEAAKIMKDGIYVSRLDLIEDSVGMEESKLPVIRFLTPVTGDDGQRLGYFVLNLVGRNLIEGLKNLGDEIGWKNYMINKDGYFLLAGNPDYQWLLRFGQDTVGKVNPEQKVLFKLFNEQKSGVIQNNQGIFCFHSINAKDLSNGYSAKVVHDDNWMVVSLLPTKAINEGIRSIISLNDILLIILSGLLLMTIAGFLAVNTHRHREIQLQLTRSEHSLRMANKTKDKFISILAHDLKNPLASIMGFVDLLKDGYEQMPQKSKDVFIKSLENSTHLLLRLIDDVLSWARSTTGSMTVEREPFLANKMLEHAVTYSQMQAEKKNIKLQTKYCDKIVGMADPRMIETIIRNLISNAIKFSYNDSSVEIEMCQDTGLVYISVIDHGVGIDEKRARNLFSLDQFTSTPGTGNEKGTGMGLILCRDFIKKNKGDITVHSKLGEGSTFTISFPAYVNE